MASTQINGQTQIQAATVTTDRFVATWDANLIHKDGSVTPTAHQPMGGFKITGMADPTANTDAATKQYVDNAVAGFSWKASVRVATSAAGTLASSFANGQTVDGVTLATGDRILIKNQSTGSENGLYTVNASGAPTRATDADTSAEVKGAAVFVEQGTANADTAWVCTTDSITLGSTALTFVKFSSTGTAPSYADNETPSGTINGSNTAFTLANSPSPTGSLQLYLNGVVQEPGAGNDYTLSGSSITMLSAPPTGSKLRAWYRY